MNSKFNLFTVFLAAFWDCFPYPTKFSMHVPYDFFDVKELAICFYSEGFLSVFESIFPFIFILYKMKERISLKGT